MTDPTPEPSDITLLLERWRSGDRRSEAVLLAQVYPVLQAIARAQVRRNNGVLTLQATELVNEACTRLLGARAIEWVNRDHFYAIAARMIRHVVVDYLRQRGAEKRGGGAARVMLDQLGDHEAPSIDESVDWLAVDQALTELEVRDPESARIVELKFFSGLSIEQIAAVTGTSTATVKRRWRYARAKLARRLGVV